VLGLSLILIILYTGCAKEYSFEGGPPVIVDTLPGPGNNPGQGNNTSPWTCPACIGQDMAIESKWSFHNDSTLICGVIDTAIVNPERTGFTFFGPSACSIDTGIIIQVLLDSPLNKDQYQITGQQGTIFYYDNVGQTFILISPSASIFSLIIDSYIHQTKMATGRFSGPVYRANGDSSYVEAGKFKVKLI